MRPPCRRPVAARPAAIARLAWCACLLASLAACDPAGPAAPADRAVASIYDEPLQSPADEEAPIERGDVRLVPRASYEIAGRLLSTERYRLDALAPVAPVDFALAWGPAASEDVQAELRVTQGNRWFYWRTRGDRFPLPRRELVANMANVHVIPADDDARAALLAFDAGECVWLRGTLVDIVGEHDPSLSRRTSRTRTDSGPGSCEILLVREAAGIACE